MTDPRFTDPRFTDSRYDYPRVGGSDLDSQSSKVAGWIGGLLFVAIVVFAVIAGRHPKGDDMTGNLAPPVSHSQRLPQPVMPLPPNPGSK